MSSNELTPIRFEDLAPNALQVSRKTLNKSPKDYGIIQENMAFIMWDPV